MYLSYGSNWKNKDKSKPIRQVFRAITDHQMERIIERQIDRGWIQVGEVVQKSETNPLFNTAEPYRYKVVMEFRRKDYDSKG